MHTLLRDLPSKMAAVAVEMCVNYFRQHCTDDSSEVMLEAVSPVDVILDPPEKLVIEVESSGGYYRHAWYKNDEQLYPNDDTTFREANPARFSEFFQVFVQDATNTSDHGIYRVDLVEGTVTTIISVYQTLEFSVTPPGEFDRVFKLLP